MLQFESCEFFILRTMQYLFFFFIKLVFRYNFTISLALYDEISVTSVLCSICLLTKITLEVLMLYNCLLILVHSSLSIILVIAFSCNASRPHTWYPRARNKIRKVFLHVGPTNSGKTHRALKRLELSSTGIT